VRCRPCDRSMGLYSRIRGPDCVATVVHQDHSGIGADHDRLLPWRLERNAMRVLSWRSLMAAIQVATGRGSAGQS